MKLKLLAMATVAALALGACESGGGGGGGGGPSAEDDPTAALTAALDSLSEAEGFTVTVSLVSTPEDLTAVSEGDITAEQAQQILDSSITAAGRNTSDPEETEGEITADIAGIDDAVEIRTLGTTVYLRGDVRALAEEFGADTSQLDAVAQQAASQGFDFVGPAIEGDWIALEGLEQLQQASGLSEESLAQQQKLVADAANAIKQSADVSFEGTDDTGDHLVALIPLRKAAEELFEVAQQLGQTGAGVPPTSEIPDEDVQLDVWVDDGQLRQVELDLVQFFEMSESEDVPAGVDEFGLRVAFEEDWEEIEAPEVAESVNIQELMQTFMGGFGTGEATAPAPTGNASQKAFCDALVKELRTAPPNVQKQALEQVGDQCPNLEDQL